jgi:hypothetical protein
MHDDSECVVRVGISCYGTWEIEIMMRFHCTKFSSSLIKTLAWSISTKTLHSQGSLEVDLMSIGT